MIRSNDTGLFNSKGMTKVLPLPAVGAVMFTAAAVGAWVAAGRYAVAQDASGKSQQKEQHGSGEARSPRVEKIKNLIARLASNNFDEREGAMDDLRAMGDEALKQLDDAGENATDQEIRWNARRVAREIRRGERSRVKSLRDLNWQAKDGSSKPAPAPQHAGKSPKTESAPSDKSEIEDFIENSFKDGRFGSSAGSVHEQIEKNMERMRRQVEEMQRLIEKSRIAPRLPSSGITQFRNSSGTSVQVGPDGVKVTITRENENGENETKTYEAPSEAEFREKYPEIAEEHLGGMHIFQIPGISTQSSITIDPFRGARGGLAPMITIPGIAEADDVNLESIIGPDNGERLGVTVQVVPVDVYKFLGLEAGQGFMVGDVTEGSLASDLSLKPRDVVLKINGRKIGENDLSIREALADVPQGETLKVELVRGMEGRLTLETKKVIRKQR